MRANRSLFLTAILAATALALAGCGGPPPAPADSGGDDELAPPFTLNDLDGNPVSLADYDGQVRIIDFWATWCAPCREEVPMYKELFAEYDGKGVKIISISMDGPDNLDAVREFVARYEIPYTNLMDDEEVSLQYRAAGLPATYVVDGQGRIVRNFVGIKPKKVLVGLIEGLLQDGSGTAGS